MKDDHFFLIFLGMLLTFLLLLMIFTPSECHAAERRMVTSFYGSESGSQTASGERFSPRGYTAAHRSLPFGTRLKVCYRGCVVVRVNDRGPAKWTHRSLDLSKGAAHQIGMLSAGVVTTTVEVL